MSETYFCKSIYKKTISVTCMFSINRNCLIAYQEPESIF